MVLSTYLFLNVSTESSELCQHRFRLWLTSLFLILLPITHFYNIKLKVRFKKKSTTTSFVWLKRKVLVCTIDASVGKYLFFLFSIITSTTFTGCWKLLLKKEKMKNDQRKVNFTLPTPICLSVEADLHQLASSLGRTRRREGGLAGRGPPKLSNTNAATI